ncbi:hypothetical protein ALC53_06662 [Atta colombica]|uniref:Uncharacterized protein n=1 Tax=Atta colombica TaxID=520822 RepID=A0A195BFK5_9HYME|nr:hypothetical protein ALC53_06662 [Atta colombica]
MKIAGEIEKQKKLVLEKNETINDIPFITVSSVSAILMHKTIIADDDSNVHKYILHNPYSEW